MVKNIINRKLFTVNRLQKNKKGWIKVIEAFMAIMMLLTIVFIIINSNTLRSADKSHIEDRSAEILRFVQLNDSLRSDVLSYTNFSSDSIEPDFPVDVARYANYSVSGVFCYFRICNITDACDGTRNFDDEVYAKDILITSDLTEYNPRKLKIFCTKDEI